MIVSGPVPLTTINIKEVAFRIYNIKGLSALGDGGIVKRKQDACG